MFCSLLCYLFYSVVAYLVACLLFRGYMKYTSGVCNIKHSLKGKNYLVTGATRGIGRETVKKLAEHGATVYLACRNRSRANCLADIIKQQTGNQNIFVLHLDLCSLTSVRKCAEDFLALNVPLHCLINNAGCFSSKVKKVTEDGLETTMAANHFGHFLLTNLLVDKLKESQPSRVVVVSSMGHLYANKFDAFNANYLNGGYDWMTAYADSKLANVLFTNELARRLQDTGVVANSLHPGAINTDILSGLPKPLEIVKQPAMLAVKTPLEGAQTTLFLATAPEVEHITGRYFSDCVPGAPSLLAVNMKLSADLWAESERLTGMEKN